MRVVGVAVTPEGRPLTAMATTPVKLLRALAEMLTDWPPAPAVRVSEAGLRVREKSGSGEEAAVTVRLTEAVWVREPAEPAKEIVAVDEPALEAAVRVRVCAVPGVSVRVEGLAVTPAGRPVSATETADEKPFAGVAFTETVCLAPAAIVAVEGVAVRVKSGAGLERAGVLLPPQALRAASAKSVALYTAIRNESRIRAERTHLLQVEASKRCAATIVAATAKDCAQKRGLGCTECYRRKELGNERSLKVCLRELSNEPGRLWVWRRMAGCSG